MVHSPDNHGITYIFNNSYYSGVIDVPADPNGVGELQITEAAPSVFGSDGCMVHCPD
jgi:hypothetical protein